MAVYSRPFSALVLVGVAPGITFSRLIQLRPASGISDTCLACTVAKRTAESLTSACSAVADTVTDLRGRAHVQRDLAERHLLEAVHAQVLDLLFLETRVRDRHRVRPHHHGRERKQSRFVGRGHARDLRAGLRQADGGAGDDAAAGVLNDAGNGTQSGLGQERARRQQRATNRVLESVSTWMDHLFREQCGTGISQTLSA